MSEQRQHFLLSYLKTLSGCPAGVWTHNLPHGSPVLYQLSYNRSAVGRQERLWGTGILFNFFYLRNPFGNKIPESLLATKRLPKSLRTLAGDFIQFSSGQTSDARAVPAILFQNMESIILGKFTNNSVTKLKWSQIFLINKEEEKQFSVWR